MGIFFICIIALIDLTRQSLMMSRDLEFVEPDVGWVATELSLTNKVEDGLMETGDFGEYYAGWSWQREVRIYPPLDELGADLDDIGLYQVDIQVNGPGGSQTHSVLMYRGSQDMAMVFRVCEQELPVLHLDLDHLQVEVSADEIATKV